MGIGDWGLGIGDWGLGPIPNPQYIYNILSLIILYLISIYKIFHIIILKFFLLKRIIIISLL